MRAWAAPSLAVARSNVNRLRGRAPWVRALEVEVVEGVWVVEVIEEASLFLFDHRDDLDTLDDVALVRES